MGRGGAGSAGLRGGPSGPTLLFRIAAT
ncbi:DUF6053 domain-containing protein [Lysobacter enzymogenes]